MNENISKLIIKGIKHKNWTTLQLAESMKKTEKQILKWINKNPNMTLSTICELESILDIKIILI